MVLRFLVPLLEMCALAGWLAGVILVQHSILSTHSHGQPASSITPPGCIDHTQNSSTVINVCLFLASLLMEIAAAVAAMSCKWGTVILGCYYPDGSGWETQPR